MVPLVAAFGQLVHSFRLLGQPRDFPDRPKEPATPRGTALPTAMKDVYRSSPTTPASATHA
jgi:hypothetical protein